MLPVFPFRCKLFRVCADNVNEGKLVLILLIIAKRKKTRSAMIQVFGKSFGSGGRPPGRGVTLFSHSNHIHYFKEEMHV